MNFRHLDPPLHFEQLEEYYPPEGGRRYIAPDGTTHPSVTTVLSAGTDQSWKARWIARVGEQKAEQISLQATNRGTAVHKLLEDYINNDPKWTAGHMPVNIMSVKKILPALNQHVGTVYASEAPLWSKALRVAGRVDCVAEWDNKLSIIDFKTSTKQKLPEYITNYFMQTAAYSYMLYERTQLVANQVVVIITVDEGNPQIFIEKPKSWLQKFIEVRNSAAI